MIEVYSPFPLLRLLQMVEECFGASAKAQVNEIDENRLPVILIAYKEKGSIGIKSVVQGEIINTKVSVMWLWCQDGRVV